VCFGGGYMASSTASRVAIFILRVLVFILLLISLIVLTTNATTVDVGSTEAVRMHFNDISAYRSEYIYTFSKIPIARRRV
jgi:hypothetical protein